MQSPDEDVDPLIVKPTPTRSTVLLPVKGTDVVDPILTDEPHPSPTDDHLIASLRRSRPKMQSPDEDVDPLIVTPTPTMSTVLLPVKGTDVVDPILTDEPHPSPTDDHLITSLRRSRPKMQSPDEDVDPLIVTPTPTMSTVLLPVKGTDVVDPILTDEPHPSPTDDHLITSLRRSRPKMQSPDEDVNPLIVKPMPTRSTVLLPVKGTDVVDPIPTDEPHPSPTDDHLITSLRRSRPKMQSPDEDVDPLIVKPTPTRSTVLLPVKGTDVVDPILTHEPHPSPTDDHLITSLRRSRPKMQFPEEYVDPLIVKPTPTRLLPVDDTDIVDPILTDEPHPSPTDDHLITSLRR
ncbi:MAG: hypothetical protein KVP17_003239, partial [Porospora cf. gigantea B]